jgi:hypothetical protein
VGIFMYRDGEKKNRNLDDPLADIKRHKRYLSKFRITNYIAANGFYGKREKRKIQ